MQILQIDHNRLAIKLLRSCLNSLEEYKQQAKGTEDNKETGTAGISDTPHPARFTMHSGVNSRRRSYSWLEGSRIWGISEKIYWIC